MTEVLSQDDPHKMRCLRISDNLKNNVLAGLAEDPNTSPDQSLQTSPVSSRAATPPPPTRIHTRADVPQPALQSTPAPPSAIRSKLAQVQSSEDCDQERARDGSSPMRTHDINPTHTEPLGQKASQLVEASESDSSKDAKKKSKRKSIGAKLKRTFSTKETG